MAPSVREDEVAQQPVRAAPDDVDARHTPARWPAGRMTSRIERAIVNAAGLVQGIVLVTFPAASS